MESHHRVKLSVIQSLLSVYRPNRLIDQVGRVFANGPGDLGFNPRSRHTKDFKNATWYVLS